MSAPFRRTVLGIGAALALLVLLPLAALAANAVASGADFDTKAPFAILIDYESGTVIFQKNAD